MNPCNLVLASVARLAGGCVLMVYAVVSTVGCTKAVTFPAESMPTVAQAMGAYRAYDVSPVDGQADFFLFADANGRVNRLGYDANGQGKATEIVNLDALTCQHSRHLVIILDGFGYDVVKDFYDRGGLRVCYPPSKVIAPYPTLTDTSLEDALGGMPCPGFEALYYDRIRNKVVGGALAYLNGENEPYNHQLQYRANSILDAVGYLYPSAVFRKELRDAKAVFDKRLTKETLAYFVSSAGISTKFGAAGQLEALRGVEQLVNQVLYETHGLTKITITADHGHSYTPSTAIPIDKHLLARGWRLCDSLKEPKDVAYIQFGLETYAAFSTRSPGPLAKDLMDCDGVELASYADGDAVVVLGRGVPAQGASQPAAKSPVQSAVVRMKNGRYAYQMTSGDPLGLKDVLAKVIPDDQGYYSPQDLMQATIDAYYPLAMERLWRAHFGLADHVPDVIVSLEDRFYSGSTSFGGAVSIASTHGALNRRNSTTFIMSTAGPLPPAMRSGEVPAAMKELLGEPWPTKK